MEKAAAAGSRWRRTIKVRTEADKVSSKGLGLAGFSFGAMVFAMGFFQSDVGSSGPLVISLLWSSVLFLMAAELADYSVRFWELFVAELAYFAGALSLFIGLTWFIWQKFSFFGWSPYIVLALPSLLYLLLAIQTVRTAINTSSRGGGLHEP